MEESIGKLEYDYYKAIQKMANLSTTPDRTGTGVKILGPITFTHEFADGIPKLVGKAVYPILAFSEMLWFLQGKTDKESLNKLGVHYWDPWFREDGTIGKSYGYQFRHTKKDQLKELIKGLLEDPFSRRHIIELWNINDLEDMALPPCFHKYQFYIENTDLHYRLNMVVSSRSTDAFLGVPYNFLSSYFLMYIIWEALEANNIQESFKNKLYIGSITWQISHLHLYANHLEEACRYELNVLEYSQKYKKVKQYIPDLPNEIKDPDIDIMLGNIERAGIKKLFGDHIHSTIPSLTLYKPEVIKAEIAI